MRARPFLYFSNKWGNFDAEFILQKKWLWGVGILYV
jgi:hypothetical protein